MSENCGDCSFYRDRTKQPVANVRHAPHGECRRHSPTLFAKDDGRGKFPLVKAVDWCGDFERKRDDPPKAGFLDNICTGGFA